MTDSAMPKLPCFTLPHGSHYPEIVQKLIADLHSELPAGPICKSVWMGRMEAISKKWPEIILAAMRKASKMGLNELEKKRG